MKLETILTAAKNSMIRGKHTPHCYSAHVIGQGYVNRGDRVDLLPDYLRQLERTVESEIANLGYAPDYAEPGYETPKRGILFANWNCFPKNFDRVLEKLGYAVEWDDEWGNCEDCNKAFRHEADSFCWEPAYKEIEGSFLCLDCAKRAE